MSSQTELNPSMETQQKEERRAKRFYISLVLLLFAIQATILGTAIKLAIGDPALAVVPDYHQAALNWDESYRASLASERLGWNVDVIVSDVSDAKGQRAISVELHNQQGKSLDDLHIDAVVYRHADAGAFEAVELLSTGEGRYLGMASMPQQGLWQLELTVDGAGEPMTLSRTLELEN
ncbi:MULTISPECIES: FixH family protein [Rhodopirellula]|uniref:FixH family protein n=1 Tax=Rhodopirellula TaxID=265488 RepID=UPI00257B4C60|nr:FixH family protein [Rhodopirellula sp. UBA1907]|tara:strand:- start:5021 stop:5554 length:534 start_codon:yes stop_codon:yes gene_type:complete